MAVFSLLARAGSNAAFGQFSELASHAILREQPFRIGNGRAKMCDDPLTWQP